MAYAPTTNPPNRLVGSIDGSVGPNLWGYSSADSDATVKAANYFSDAYSRGIRVGDVIFVNVVGTGTYIHHVLTCTAAGACTVTQTPATST